MSGIIIGIYPLTETNEVRTGREDVCKVYGIKRSYGEEDDMRRGSQETMNFK
jgi:hypothetical protein